MLENIKKWNVDDSSQLQEGQSYIAYFLIIDEHGQERYQTKEFSIVEGFSSQLSFDVKNIVKNNNINYYTQSSPVVLQIKNAEEATFNVYIKKKDTVDPVYQLVKDTSITSNNFSYPLTQFNIEDDTAYTVKMSIKDKASNTQMLTHNFICDNKINLAETDIKIRNGILLEDKTAYSLKDQFLYVELPAEDLSKTAKLKTKLNNDLFYKEVASAEKEDDKFLFITDEIYNNNDIFTLKIEITDESTFLKTITYSKNIVIDKACTYHLRVSEYQKNQDGAKSGVVLSMVSEEFLTGSVIIGTEKQEVTKQKSYKFHFPYLSLQGVYKTDVTLQDNFGNDCVKVAPSSPLLINFSQQVTADYVKINSLYMLQLLNCGSSSTEIDLKKILTKDTCIKIKGTALDVTNLKFETIWGIEQLDTTRVTFVDTTNTSNQDQNGGDSDSEIKSWEAVLNFKKQAFQEFTLEISAQEMFIFRVGYDVRNIIEGKKQNVILDQIAWMKWRDDESGYTISQFGDKAYIINSGGYSSGNSRGFKIAVQIEKNAKGAKIKLVNEISEDDCDKQTGFSDSMTCVDLLCTYTKAPGGIGDTGLKTFTAVIEVTDALENKNNYCKNIKVIDINKTATKIKTGLPFDDGVREANHLLFTEEYIGQALEVGLDRDLHPVKIYAGYYRGNFSTGERDAHLIDLVSSQGHIALIDYLTDSNNSCFNQSAKHPAESCVNTEHGKLATLGFAILRGYGGFKVLEKLVEKGAEVTLSNSDDWNYLHYLSAFIKDMSTLNLPAAYCKFLVDHGVDSNHHAGSGSRKRVPLMLLFVSFQYETKDKEDKEDKEKIVFNCILKSPTYNPNILDAEGKNILIYVLYHTEGQMRIDFTTALIKKGVDLLHTYANKTVLELINDAVLHQQDSTEKYNDQDLLDLLQNAYNTKLAEEYRKDGATVEKLKKWLDVGTKYTKELYEEILKNGNRAKQVSGLIDKAFITAALDEGVDPNLGGVTIQMGSQTETGHLIHLLVAMDLKDAVDVVINKDSTRKQEISDKKNQSGHSALWISTELDKNNVQDELLKKGATNNIMLDSQYKKCSDAAALTGDLQVMENIRDHQCIRITGTIDAKNTTAKLKISIGNNFVKSTDVKAISGEKHAWQAEINFEDVLNKNFSEVNQKVVFYQAYYVNTDTNIINYSKYKFLDMSYFKPPKYGVNLDDGTKYFKHTDSLTIDKGAGAISKNSDSITYEKLSSGDIKFTFSLSSFNLMKVYYDATTLAVEHSKQSGAISSLNGKLTKVQIKDNKKTPNDPLDDSNLSEHDVVGVTTDFDLEFSSANLDSFDLCYTTSQNIQVCHTFQTNELFGI